MQETSSFTPELQARLASYCERHFGVYLSPQELDEALSSLTHLHSALFCTNPQPPRNTELHGHAQRAHEVARVRAEKSAQHTLLD